MLLAHLVERYMSIVFYNILFFFSVAPLWSIKFAIDIDLRILIYIIFTTLIIVNYLILRKIKKNSFFFTIYIAFILTYGIDNNFGLFSDLIAPNVKIFYPLNTYLVGFLLILFIFFINYFIVKKISIKGSIIIFVLILTNFLYASFLGDKSMKNFPDFVINDIKIEKKNKIILVFIMDQMAGLNSDASKTEIGKKFDIDAIKFSKKYETKIYNNIFTQCIMTYESIPKLINFDHISECKDLTKKRYIKKSNLFFSEYEILRNKLFDKFKDISVYQNYHMNFCKNKNVKKCDQYSQFKKYDYVRGFKDTKLSKFLGAWKHYGSITSNIIWRTFITLNITDSYEQSAGEKGAFLSILKKIEQDINSKKYDLIFVHSLATHNPYGFNEKCEYDGKKYINYSRNNLKEAIKGQNLDRLCILGFFDSFFQELDDKKKLSNIEFFILSDHGTRLSQSEESSNKTIFIHKSSKEKFKEISYKSVLQEVFSQIINFND